MSDPLRTMSVRETPQSEPVSGRTMIQNHAGGYGFAVDDWTQLNRFLILGTVGGTYYVGERDHTRESADLVRRLAGTDGPRLVKTITEVSVAGRAPKPNPAIFALAVAAASPDQRTRQLAYDALPKVCRTGTHLFTFAEYVQAQRGWGRGLRRAVANWYETKPADKLAYQLVKYRQRDGWTHRDLLRLSHPAGTGDHKPLYDFACGRPTHWTAGSMIEGYKTLQEASDRVTSREVAHIISTHHLPWEAVPSEFLSHGYVWEALLPDMGLTALIRNLARLTRLGVISPMSETTSAIAGRLTDPAALKAARIHPIQILDALMTYQLGRGVRGGDSWRPVSQIVDALDQAFYLSFGTIEPANKRTLLAVDVSGSMGWGTVGGSAVLTPRVAAAAMAMVTAGSEPQHLITAFSHRMEKLSVSPRQRLTDVLDTFDRIPFGRTDCSQPMLHARDNKLQVDTFVVLTDNETWCGWMHPFQALRQYREQSGIPARLVVVAMTATNFTIADPDDAGMLDVVGFDTATPSILSAFSRGEV